MSVSLPKQKKLIPISEAAKVLGVSIDTVRRWDKSGVLHSERPDGKNRYYSLNELDKYKSGQPLSISQAAKELDVSATTLRRLEERGLIKPERNSAGERVYGKNSLKNFLNSGYFLRKKHNTEKVLEPSREEKELTEAITFEGEDQSAANYPPESTESSEVESSTKIHSDTNLKPLQRMPEFLAAGVIFSLLVTIGVININVSKAKSPLPSPTPAVLSITETSDSLPSPTPAVLSITEEVEEVGTASAYEVIPKVMLKIEVDDKSANVNIQEKPTTESERIGQARDGDTFEFVAIREFAVSVDSGWYEVRLPDGSTGFIPAKYIAMGETNN